MVLALTAFAQQGSPASSDPSSGAQSSTPEEEAAAQSLQIDPLEWVKPPVPKGAPPGALEAPMAGWRQADPPGRRIRGPPRGRMLGDAAFFHKNDEQGGDEAWDLSLRVAGLPIWRNEGEHLWELGFSYSHHFNMSDEDIAEGRGRIGASSSHGSQSARSPRRLIR